MKKLLISVLCIMMVFQSAFAAGNIRILKDLKNPQTDWREILQNFVQEEKSKLKKIQIY